MFIVLIPDVSVTSIVVIAFRMSIMIGLVVDLFPERTRTSTEIVNTKAMLVCIVKNKYRDSKYQGYARLYRK